MHLLLLESFTDFNNTSPGMYKKQYGALEGIKQFLKDWRKKQVFYQSQ